MATYLPDAYTGATEDSTTRQETGTTYLTQGHTTDPKSKQKRKTRNQSPRQSSSTITRDNSFCRAKNGVLMGADNILQEFFWINSRKGEGEDTYNVNNSPIKQHAYTHQNKAPFHCIRKWGGVISGVQRIGAVCSRQERMQFWKGAGRLSYMFKKKSECNRVLQMIREDGERFCVEQPGRMNITKHNTVLHLLERRAIRLRKSNNITTNKNHDWSVGKTGTVDININQLGDIQQQ